ncbi:MAG: AraC family transcriptional regulator [Lentisphaerae bacterium]|nr:AraC family transcriptional regulator [Lentisphaerota bacterium]
MKKFWVTAYSPQRDSLLFVRSCGHCCVDNSHRERVRMIDYANFYWCVEGSGYFKNANKYCKIQPGDVWYMPCKSWHDFYPGDEGFHYYWLAFEGEGMPILEQILKLTPGKKFCGPAPDELFRQIIAGLRHLTPERRLEIMGIAFQVLFRIASAPLHREGQEKNIAREARELIEREFTDPAFNVNRLAELLTVHRVTLCREFKKAFRISPSAYLKGCRLRKAVEMLSQHCYTIKEIAFSCGFSSQEYFATVFLAEFGHSPSSF